MLESSIMWKLLGTFIGSTEWYVVLMYYFLVFVSSHFSVIVLFIIAYSWPVRNILGEVKYNVR
jgi:uncharacterized membrane protein